jgi:uncharacterized membrane protein
MKNFFKREWIFWLAMLAPAIFILIRWNNFPDKIPMHWDVNGEVNEYGGKWSIFFGPLMSLGIYLLLLVVPRLDPRKKNYDLFSGSYFLIRLALTIFLSIVSVVIALASLSYKIDVTMIVIIAVLGLLLLIGNLFGRIRPNYFVGLRTPWTLNSEEVWMKTHRLTGKLWVGGTLLMLLLIWFIPMKTFSYFLIGYILVIVIIPVIYSWRIYRKIENGK